MKSKYYALNGIKGILAIAIACIYHIATIDFPYTLTRPFGEVSWIEWVYSNGGSFVEFFLVLSGFTSCLVYTARIDDGENFSAFIKKRFFRLFPLILFSLITSLIMDCIFFARFNHPFFKDGSTNTFVSFTLAIFGMSAIDNGIQSWNFPAWSITVFLICWVIFYFVVFSTKSNKDLRVWLMALIVFIGLFIQFIPSNTAIFLFNSDMSRGYISFFSGTILCHIYQILKDRDKNILALAFAIYLILIYILSLAHIQMGNLTVFTGMFLWPILTFFVLHLEIINKFFLLKPLQFLGDISFHIYLMNYTIEIIFYLLLDRIGLIRGMKSIPFYISYIVIHVLVAYLVMRVLSVVEKNIKIRLKNKT
ncbi:acyltransferase family protein [Lachnoanaerobaculum gingivalis]